MFHTVSQAAKLAYTLPIYYILYIIKADRNERRQHEHMTHISVLLEQIRERLTTADEPTATGSAPDQSEPSDNGNTYTNTYNNDYLYSEKER